MSALLAIAGCPNCGAPQAAKPSAQTVICIYCNTSLTVVKPPAGQPAAAAGPQELTAKAVPKEAIERIIQLLVDGKREEAIAFYAQVATASRAEAESAIESMVVSSYFELTKRLPINPVGFVGYTVLTLIGFGGAAWAGLYAIDTPWLGVVALLSFLFAVHRAFWFGRHVRSTYYNFYGDLGKARVIRQALLRSDKTDGHLVAVIFEVTPDDGSPSFMDQENLFVSGVGRDKLSPGNILPVRFSSDRELVFPISPMTVIGTVR